jgi:hypothetical protein
VAAPDDDLLALDEALTQLAADLGLSANTLYYRIRA